MDFTARIAQNDGSSPIEWSDDDFTDLIPSPATESMDMENPAYFIAEVVINDSEGLQPYLDKVEATLAPFDARPLANTNVIAGLEGETPAGRVVILEFKDMDSAQAWYGSPAYQNIIGARLVSATSRVYILEGLTA
ncbi:MULTISPECIES: DUF1330 domain-containing protein [unclassified Asaia]|uniref:DUF1330 domain-containing protein n=1 Tax=unclassified Asaia TaxID=2685023 RepID=UPI000F8EC2B9|nr:DUF1330 domain-containing protein [Asaia sp. W19]